MKFAILLGLATVLVALIPNATGKEVTCYDCEGSIAGGTDKGKRYANCKDGKLADLPKRNCTTGCSISHVKGTDEKGIKVESFARDCLHPHYKIGCDKTIPPGPGGASIEKYEVCNCEGDLCNGGTSLDSRRISLLAILIPSVITAINAYY